MSRIKAFINDNITPKIETPIHPKQPQVMTLVSYSMSTTYKKSYQIDNAYRVKIFRIKRVADKLYFIIKSQEYGRIK